MTDSTWIFNTPGTYDLNGNYSGYGSYAIDCTAGDITLSMQQAFAIGLYYQILRLDNSSNTLTVNAYSGDTMNGVATTYTIPPGVMTWCEVYVSGNWVMPFQSVTFAP